MWYLYICLRGNQLYTGITTNLDNRMRQHGAELLYSESYENKHVAAQREKEIKGWRREKKLELIRRSR
ncbi:MAG TPA: GIY-YIG nuclease family protein [Thermodesulfobacteriota bacterium]|nr:GIY-YIG nuclease family protein [Thermodesulfobacteriota bacterium]